MPSLQECIYDDFSIAGILSNHFSSIILKNQCVEQILYHAQKARDGGVQ